MQIDANEKFSKVTLKFESKKKYLRLQAHCFWYKSLIIRCCWSQRNRLTEGWVGPATSGAWPQGDGQTVSLLIGTTGRNNRPDNRAALGRAGGPNQPIALASSWLQNLSMNCICSEITVSIASLYSSQCWDWMITSPLHSSLPACLCFEKCVEYAGSSSFYSNHWSLHIGLQKYAKLAKSNNIHIFKPLKLLALPSSPKLM